MPLKEELLEVENHTEGKDENLKVSCSKLLNWLNPR